MNFTFNPEMFNTLLWKLRAADRRFVINYGGAGSSKSYTQTQFEIIKCLQRPEKLLVTRKVGTTLKDSVISLFISILNQWGLQNYYTENKSTQFITFQNGSQIIFKGMDDQEKIKSIAGITRIWNEEASELSQADFNQLNLRLRGGEGLQMTCTFNPIDEEHWIKHYFFDNPDIFAKTNIIHTTYKDNRFIDEAYKLELESYANIDKNYHKIYALGEWGGITEGRVFQPWEQIDNFPEIDGYWFGLDFGYSNDPTAIVKTIKWRGRVYFDEVCYRTGMTNGDIAALFRAEGYRNEIVICDAAEPKSIEELRRLGINAVEAMKGQGSVMAGIDFLKRQKILITKRSLNIIKENRYYQWKQDKNGKWLNENPKDFMNHCFDRDTIVATKTGNRRISEIKIGEYVLTSFGYNKVISSGITGLNKIFEFALYFRTFTIKLKCTENHLIYTTKGWKQISHLTQGMTVFLNKHSMVKHSGYTREKNTLAEVEKDFTSKYGSTLMERLTKDIAYIIKTKILFAIVLTILNVLKNLNITNITQKKGTNSIQNGACLFRKKGELLQKNGTKAKLVGNGILSTQYNKILEILHTVKTNAVFVIRSLNQILSIRYSAQISAKVNLGEIQEKTMSNQNAVAEIFLHVPNIQNKCTVQDHVLQKIEKQYINTDFVYDLTVENNMEFFANNILVHNCIDSMRYSYSLGDKMEGSGKSLIVTADDL